MADPFINPITGQSFNANITSLGSSNYNLPMTGNPDQDAAALTRAEFQRFRTKGLPAITELVDKAEDYLDPN